MAKKPFFSKTPAAEAVAEALPDVPSFVPDKGDNEPDTGGRGATTTPTPELNPRNKVAAEIAARYEKRMVADGNESVPSMDEDGNIEEGASEEDDDYSKSEDAPDEVAPLPEGEAGEASADETGTAEGEDAGESAAAAAEAFDPDGDYEIKVDGQRVKVKGAQIIAAGVQNLQKNTAADMRLEAATRMLKEAGEKAKAAGLLPEGADSDSQPAKTQQPPSQDDAELAKAIQFGSEEEATAAIRKLRSTGQATSNEEILSFVHRAIGPMIHDQISYTTARDSVVRDYPEVFGNPMLKNLFIQEERRLRDIEKDTRPYGELYPAIAEAIITGLKIERKAKPNGGAPTNARPPVDRLTRKASASSGVVHGVGGQPIPKKAEDKPMTTAEYVKQQREARGL